LVLSIWTRVFWIYLTVLKSSKIFAQFSWGDEIVLSALPSFIGSQFQQDSAFSISDRLQTREYFNLN